MLAVFGAEVFPEGIQAGVNLVLEVRWKKFFVVQNEKSEGAMLRDVKR